MEHGGLLHVERLEDELTHRAVIGISQRGVGSETVGRSIPSGGDQTAGVLKSFAKTGCGQQLFYFGEAVFGSNTLESEEQIDIAARHAGTGADGMPHLKSAGDVRIRERESR